MAAVPELIYCAAGNARFAQIAIDAGFTYGAQMPAKTFFPPEFVDQDWKKPDRDAYMAALATHRPRMATVLDWERDEQLPEVLMWAEEAAQYIETVIIIPKVMNGVSRLPRAIGGADVRLGYSVPTSYGGTELPIWQFTGWPVHLLGGSPQKQMELARYLNVHSVDGNMHMKLASQFCAYWQPGTARHAKNRYWPQLQEMGRGRANNDAPYLAFELSCAAIMKAWCTRQQGVMCNV